METLTIVLLIAIAVFAIGNILLFFLEKRNKEKDGQRLPLGQATQEVLNSKVEVLNKRVSNLEDKTRRTQEREIADERKIRVIEKEVKNEIDIRKKVNKKKAKTLLKIKAHYPITKYKRKKKK
ncbi:MAG: hypothetical protein WC932_05585 [archaeon]|jgi:hypothetical protein